MAKKLYEEEDIRAIACAIRTKCGTDCTYKVCDMAAAIETIQGEGGGSGGDYNILVSENADGTQSFAITDAGEGEATKLVTKTITSNGTYVAKNDGADGYLSVTVGVPVDVVEPTGTITIKSNGTHNVSSYAEAVVDVQRQPLLQNKTVNVNGVYTADAGYDGLGTVTVAIDTASVTPPAIGFVPTAYNENGLMTEGTWYGTKVGDSAFYYNRTLTNIVFNDAVTEIQNSAFSYTFGLTGLTELPDTITTIGGSAFYSCYAPLTKLPASLTTLGGTAFRQSKITIRNIPAGVTEIPQNCFYWCSGITSMTLHSNITTIGSSSFYKNENLTMVTFKGTPTSIDSSAFSSCTNLKTINVPWASGAIAGAPWGATNATINYNSTV